MIVTRFELKVYLACSWYNMFRLLAVVEGCLACSVCFGASVPIQFTLIQLIESNQTTQSVPIESNSIQLKSHHSKPMQYIPAEPIQSIESVNFSLRIIVSYFEMQPESSQLHEHAPHSFVFAIHWMLHHCSFWTP